MVRGPTGVAVLLACALAVAGPGAAEGAAAPADAPAAAPRGATTLVAPQGPVVLTVTGAISNPNRGPSDPFRDAFFAFHDMSFAEAAQFDRAMLEALGTRTVTTGYDTWPARFTFEGPLLRDVLAAAGAKGEVVRVFALDGYAAEIPMQTLESYPVILALKRAGEYLALGGRGPAWVIFPRDDYPALQSEDDSRWVWSVVRIHVE